MNRTVLMILAGAVLVAIVVAMLVQARLSPDAETAEAQQTIEIAVATQALPAGTRLSEENIRPQAIPVSTLFTGAVLWSEVTDAETGGVYGNPLRRAVSSGEPITRQAMVDMKLQGSYIAATLDPGMRAVVIGVDPETGSGMVRPGDRVDVILAYTPRFGTDSRDLAEKLVSRNAAQTIVSAVRVIAIDRATGEEETENLPKTVTLEVSPEQAETLALGAGMGDLSLALRRLGDTDPLIDTLTPITTDATTSEVMRRVQEALRESQTISNTVRVYSGSGVQNMPVRSQQKGNAAAGSANP